MWQSQGNEWENWSPSQAEQVPGPWRDWLEHGGRGFGWRRARFPCPGGPWGVVVADVTSGARPPSLHLYYFPSSPGPVSSSPCPGLSAACLLRRGRVQSITLPPSLHKYRHNRPNADSHWTGATMTLMTSPIKRGRLLSEELILK